MWARYAFGEAGVKMAGNFGSNSHYGSRTAAHPDPPACACTHADRPKSIMRIAAVLPHRYGVTGKTAGSANGAGGVTGADEIGASSAGTTVAGGADGGGETGVATAGMA